MTNKQTLTDKNILLKMILTNFYSTIYTTHYSGYSVIKDIFIPFELVIPSFDKNDIISKLILSHIIYKFKFKTNVPPPPYYFSIDLLYY